MRFLIIAITCSLSNIVFGQLPDYIFQSGYEGTTELQQYTLNGSPNINNADIIGLDGSYDWQIDLDDNPEIGNFRIFYEYGDTLKSKASIVNDPVSPSNNVLKFELFEPNVPVDGSPDKGRIQAALKFNPDYKEFYHSSKIYLHEDMALLETTPYPITWLTIQEYWNNLPAEENTFRVTLNLRKEEGEGEPLRFGAHGQIKEDDSWVDLWDTTDFTFDIPFGEWFTLETHYIDGNEETGFFEVKVITGSGDEYEVIKVADYTRHPDETDESSDGVKDFNPMKLYTSGPLIDTLTDVLGGSLSIYWDDFKVWKSYTAELDEYSTNTFKLFPNPVNDILNLQLPAGVNEVLIANLSGSCILRSTINNPTCSLDISQLDPGVYLVQISTTEGILSQKVIKQ